MATMNVSVPAPMREWVETQVKTGEYANTSELIRHDQRRWRELIASIAQGLNSGRSDCKAEAVMGEAKTRLLETLLALY